MRVNCKMTSLKLVCVGLSGLTGCATTAELEYLRAEVARANATAVSAAADIAKAQTEMAELKAARDDVEPPAECARPGGDLPESSARPGYKWALKDP